MARQAKQFGVYLNSNESETKFFCRTLQVSMCVRKKNNSELIWRCRTLSSVDVSFVNWGQRLIEGLHIFTPVFPMTCIDCHIFIIHILESARCLFAFSISTFKLELGYSCSYSMMITVSTACRAIKLTSVIVMLSSTLIHSNISCIALSLSLSLSCCVSHTLLAHVLAALGRCLRH